MAKRWNLANYVDALKRIRPYTTGFDAKSGFDIRFADQWTSAQKASIRRYAEMLQTLQASEYTYNYRPRSKKNLQKAREFRGVPEFKKLRVIPIEAKPDRFDEKTGKPILIKPRVKITKDGVFSVKLNGITRDTLNVFEFGYSREDLALDPVGVFKEILADTDYKYYSIIAGEHEFGRGTGVPAVLTAKQVLQWIKFFQNEYGKDTAKARQGHYYVDWMHGLKGFKFKRREDIDEWILGRRAFVSQRDQIRKQIKSAKEIIDKHRSDLITIRRAQNITKKIAQLMQGALTEEMKRAKSKQKEIQIKKARQLIQNKKGQKIPVILKEFILSFKEDQITRQERRINDLRSQRSKSFK